ncbi:MAG: class I SAM-dependent methyltransferase [Jaaginema sp. PMC 1079.18]|nr:class I SAM-dependent methyltransferase [Jaaginema sp. PMC 1080.18]MEC4850873.1 class I SAM-dependent methyltransferase [Jaaginema sp. PMC 1079.18]
MTIGETNCHVCDGDCSEFLNFSDLRQVASDCTPYKRGGRLIICQNCGIVQRPLSVDWQKATREIYSNYQLFAQGIEQLEESIFHSETGTKDSRSQQMISWLSKVIKLPLQGSLLEIGCGNGGFLASFSNHRSQWYLTGLDIADNGKNAIDKIPNAQFINGSIEILNRALKYDLVVLSHTLEHIPYPLQLLQKIQGHLSENGLLFIEVPSLESAPFDILVADHCSFFTAKTLSYLVQKSGFEIVSIAVGSLPKEISLVARRQTNTIHIIDDKCSFDSNQERVLKNLQFLNSLREQAWKFRGRTNNLGIFGSSISSSWLFGEFEEVSFFVDENPQRIGNYHLGLPIVSPTTLNRNNIVLMPFRRDIAEAIADRLSTELDLFDIFILPIDDCEI